MPAIFTFSFLCSKRRRKTSGTSSSSSDVCGPVPLKGNKSRRRLFSGSNDEKNDKYYDDYDDNDGAGGSCANNKNDELVSLKWIEYIFSKNPLVLTLIFSSQEFEAESHEPVRPPRLLNVTRLFFGDGFVEIGLKPFTDGYGNPDVNIVVVINYNNKHLELNTDQLYDFFVTIRFVSSYESYANRRYFNYTGDYLAGKFNITRNDEYFDIQLIESEGDTSRIEQLHADDLRALLKIECVIDGRIGNVGFDIEDVIGKISDIVEKYVENPNHVQISAESQHVDRTIPELVANHGSYLEDLIREYIQQKNRETE